MVASCWLLVEDEDQRNVFIPDRTDRRHVRAVRSRTSQKEVDEMNRTYEIMFIVRPDVEEADLDKLVEGFSANVVSGGGEVKSVEKMGRRRLAYTVRKFNDGFYVLMNVAIAGAGVLELEGRLRVSEPVIKFITVRMDEEEKRLAKVKALRDTKVKRSAQPAAAPVHAPVAAVAEDSAAAVAETPVAAVAEAPVAAVADAPAAVVADAPAESVAAEV
jgi:small subunit ribosomal protein S6